MPILNEERNLADVLSEVILGIPKTLQKGADVKNEELLFNLEQMTGNKERKRKSKHQEFMESLAMAQAERQEAAAQREETKFQERNQLTPEDAETKRLTNLKLEKEIEQIGKPKTATPRAPKTATPTNYRKKTFDAFNKDQSGITKQFGSQREAYDKLFRGQAELEGNSSDSIMQTMPEIKDNSQFNKIPLVPEWMEKIIQYISGDNEKKPQEQVSDRSPLPNGMSKVSSGVQTKDTSQILNHELYDSALEWYESDEGKKDKDRDIILANAKRAASK